jgi:hypothetical protein
MRPIVSIVLTAILVATLAIGTTPPAKAGGLAYMLYQMKNLQYDPPSAPWRTLLGGPYEDLETCVHIKGELSQEDSYHHVLECSYEYV